MPLWSWFFITAAIAAVILLGLLMVGSAKRRKSIARLKEQFGPEYARTVDTFGGEDEAETELVDRQERHERLDIHMLTAEQHRAFAADWRRVQAGFIDDPAGSLNDAEQLVEQLLRECGYPAEDFDQRAADLSVDYPTVVQSYRQAHRIHHDHHDGAVSTEDQRDAFVHYRTLFEQLLGGDEADRDPSVNGHQTSDIQP